MTATNSAYGRERSIGAILIDAGRLTPDSAEKILKYQKEHGVRFGDAAIAMGVLTTDDVRFALAHQFEYTYLAPGTNPATAEVVAAYQPNSPCVESMRALRSQLMLRWLDNRVDRKSLAIVSNESGAGRSFTAANLAVVFSQLGEKTLLIDANLRRPRLHELFKVENRIGLSTVLSSGNISPPIIELSAFVGLSIIPAGAVPPNPQELLSRPAFRSLIDSVVEKFDVVLIDTPSWVQGADAQIIASRAGAALLVTRLDHTSVNAATNFVETLGQSGCRVLGAILNKF
jgi:chain length determinant protein tyrosine kinase EpsG